MDMKKLVIIIVPIICVLAVIGYFLVERSYYPMGGEVAVIDKTATSTQYHIVIRETPNSEQFTLKCSKEDYDNVALGDIIDCNRMQSVLTHKGTVHSIEFSDHTLTDERFRELADRNIGSDMAVIDYASEDRVIFHYSYALIVYDLKNEAVERKLDLSTLNVALGQQGDEVIDVRAAADGSGVYISSLGAVGIDYDEYWYDIENDKVSAYLEEKEFFGDFGEFGYVDLGGWNSYRYVSLTDTKRCYLLLKQPSFIVSGILIIVDDNGEITEYSPFK